MVVESLDVSVLSELPVVVDSVVVVVDSVSSVGMVVESLDVSVP